MLTKFFWLPLVATFVFISSIVFLSPAKILALDCSASNLNTKETLQCGTSNTSGVPVTNDPQTSLNDSLRSVIELISVAVGIISTVMIIVGGFRYVTSSGDGTKIAAAKNTILFAIIGLVIVAIAQLLVKFVLHKATTTTP